jgi:hypothetical protein
MSRGNSFMSMLVRGKMAKRIYTNCPKQNKFECLINGYNGNNDDGNNDDGNNDGNNDDGNNDGGNNDNDSIKKNDSLTGSFIILYTFDIPSDPKWVEHYQMLVISILSCIREFKHLPFKIFIYTTNTKSLYNHLIQFKTIMSYITIVNYDPTDYGLPKKLLLSKDLEPFINGIGHSRVFIIDKLRQKYKCPICYMDNDTGITLGNGDACYKMIMETSRIKFYLVEKWTTFKILYDKMGQYENLMELKKKYHHIINENCNPRNNGIIIYGYNNKNDNIFVDDAIILIRTIYMILVRELPSHYNDMFAFSLACEILHINDSICEIDSNITGGDYGINPEFNVKQPLIFVHYYINKYLYLDFISYIFNRIIDLYFKQKPLELNDDKNVNNSHCLLAHVFTKKNNILVKPQEEGFGEKEGGVG